VSLWIAAVTACSWSSERSSPAVAFEDVGACPFECCAYREWTATQRTELRSQRSSTASVVASVQADERVTGVNGVVVTEESGQVRVVKPFEAEAHEGGAPVSLDTGDSVTALHYQGEGMWLCSFEGQLLSLFLPGTPGSFGDNGSEFLQVDSWPKTKWWVEVRTADGRQGWSDQPEHFAHKDACE
jgi:hypothetical protein